MNKLENALVEHSRRYPKMMPQDAVKLVYQHTFGPGHLIQDPSESYQHIVKEYQGVAPGRFSEGGGIDSIGGDYVRIHLSTLAELGLTLDHLNHMFVNTLSGGTLLKFCANLEILKLVTGAGCFSFDSFALDTYLETYQRQGYPMVSHSLIYKEAYKPHYRIIDHKYLPLIPLISVIYEKLLKQENVIVALEGMAASGKSTASKLLSTIFDCHCIHLDDFFLPLELRTQERFNEIGGNIHYERFQKEVIQGLQTKKEFDYRVFDCSVMAYSKTVHLVPQGLVIIEGVYSMHPYFGNYFDVGGLFEIDTSVQHERLLMRSSEALMDKFVHIWLPMEKRYFDKLKHSEALIVIKT